MSRFIAAVGWLVALSSMSAGANAQSFAKPPQRAPAPVVATAAASPAVADAATIDRAALRARLAAARAENVRAFVAYEKRRVYPSNTTRPGPANIWRDGDGHLCAAATIIDRSGAHELVRHIADTDNGLRLVNVEAGPVMDWILESGLTQEELVLIQRPFMPVVKQVQPEPQPVDVALRAKETARLAAVYQRIEKELASEQQAALDTATDRLLAHPELAAELASR